MERDALPNAMLIAFLDRLYAAHGDSLMYKPCGCMVHGNTPDEVRADQEGMEIAYNLGRNMAWMVQALHSMPYIR